MGDYFANLQLCLIVLKNLVFVSKETILNYFCKYLPEAGKDIELNDMRKPLIYFKKCTMHFRIGFIISYYSNLFYKIFCFHMHKRILASPNSRAGFPYGAAEIFSLMQHMGCEPDRASYNILVDAYGRAGFQEGKVIDLSNGL